jgi:O-antigen/teichoic acid export membrane protein
MQTFTTITEVGQYVVVFQLGYAPIAMATGLMANFIAPILFQRSGDTTDHARNINVHRLTWRIVQLSLLFTAVGFLITSIFHELIFRILVATLYRGSSYLLPWVLLAGGVFAASQVLGIKLASEMKVKEQITPKIVTALIGALCNLLGAAYAGIDGVVGALVVFSVINFFWMSMLSRNTLVKL